MDIAEHCVGLTDDTVCVQHDVEQTTETSAAAK